MNDCTHIMTHCCTERIKKEVSYAVRNYLLTFKGTLHALTIALEKEKKPTVVIEIHDNLKEVKTFLLKRKQNEKLSVIAVIDRALRDKVNISDVTVKNNSKLTVVAASDLVINGSFEIKSGSELEIK